MQRRERLEIPVLRVVTATNKLALSQRFPPKRQSTTMAFMRSFSVAVLQLRKCHTEVKNKV